MGSRPTVSRTGGQSAPSGIDSDVVELRPEFLPRASTFPEAPQTQPQSRRHHQARQEAGQAGLRDWHSEVPWAEALPSSIVNGAVSLRKLGRSSFPDRRDCCFTPL